MHNSGEVLRDIPILSSANKYDLCEYYVILTASPNPSTLLETPRFVSTSLEQFEERLVDTFYGPKARDTELSSCVVVVTPLHSGKRL
jgi:hypothetical protein